MALEEGRPAGFQQIVNSDEESYVRVTLRAAFTGEYCGEQMFYLHSSIEGPRLGDILSWAKELSGAAAVDVFFVPRPGADTVSCAIRPLDTLRSYIEELPRAKRMNKRRGEDWCRRGFCFALDAQRVIRSKTQERLRLVFHRCTRRGRVDPGIEFVHALQHAKEVHTNGHDDVVSVQSGDLLRQPTVGNHTPYCILFLSGFRIFCESRCSGPCLRY